MKKVATVLMKPTIPPTNRVHVKKERMQTTFGTVLIFLKEIKADMPIKIKFDKITANTHCKKVKSKFVNSPM